MSALSLTLLGAVLLLGVACDDTTGDGGPSADGGAPNDGGAVDDGGAPPGDGGPPTDGGTVDAGACDEDTLSEMYTKYVEPFVSGAVPQSCSQCHFSGVDMSLYGQDNPCDTMDCMIDLGVVDLDDPESSLLLSQILLGDPDSSVFSVDTEHQAMLEWINFSARCHDAICGEPDDNPCALGTGAPTTGVNPIGDCSEEDLLAVFWDAVIVDRGRCNICHSSYAYDVLGKFGPCTSTSECQDPQLCVEGFCRAPGAVNAPHFFEGDDTSLLWSDPADRQLGLNTMYNVIALGLLDTDTPLNSRLLTKPLLEGFQPTAVFGPGVDVSAVPEGEGVGVFHGGTSKFNFGFHDPATAPSAGVVDCRRDTPCGNVDSCGPGEQCQEIGGAGERFCVIAGSYCDPTYTNFLRFAEYFATCSAQP